MPPKYRLTSVPHGVGEPEPSSRRGSKNRAADMPLLVFRPGGHELGVCTWGWAGESGNEALDHGLTSEDTRISLVLSKWAS